MWTIDTKQCSNMQLLPGCKAGRFDEAEKSLSHLLDILRRHGSTVEDSPVMYWYLVARYKGDERKAKDEFVQCIRKKDTRTDIKHVKIRK